MDPAQDTPSQPSKLKIIDQNNTDLDWNILDQSFGEYPSILFDRNYGLILMVNQAFCGLVKYPQQSLVGHHLSMLLPNISVEKLLEQNKIEEQILDGEGEVFNVNVEVVKLQQETEAVLIAIHLLEPEVIETANDRRFDYILNLLSLAEEPTLDQAINKAMGILRKLFHANVIAFYWVDENSPSMKRIAGYDPGKIMPRILPSSDLMMLSKPMVWRNNHHQFTKIDTKSLRLNLRFLLSIPLGVRAGVVGLVLIGDARNAAPDGLEKLLELTRANLNSMILHFILTKSLQNEISRLKSTITIHENVAENLKDGLFVLSQNLNILEINTASEIMFGYAAHEVINVPVEDVLIGSSLLLSSLSDAQTGLAAHNLGPVQLHHRGGFPFSARLKILPVLVNETVDKIILLISDNSEFEQITLRTQQLEHRAILGEFISAFAHDVRNPINNISTSLQLLDRKLVEQDPNRSIVNRLSEDCDRLTQLMESFLSYSRLVDNTRFEVLDIAQIAQRIVSKWKPTLDNQGILLNFSSAASLPMVKVDRRAMERVFVNLISNAVDAMNENVDHPMLGIRITKEETSSLLKQQVRISISDNGSGIPPELKERIFDPFTSTKGEGTGLGLSISKQIITAHRGTITVESFPGGTVFHILLPVREIEEDESERINH